MIRALGLVFRAGLAIYGQTRSVELTASELIAVDKSALSFAFTARLPQAGLFAIETWTYAL